MHIAFNYSFTTSFKPSITSSLSGEDGHETSALTEALLAFDSCWNRENKFLCCFCVFLNYMTADRLTTTRARQVPLSRLAGYHKLGLEWKEGKKEEILQLGEKARREEWMVMGGLGENVLKIHCKKFLKN